MLSPFPRVRLISTLVPRLAAAGRRACRHRTPRATLRAAPTTLARAPAPPYLTDARTTQPRRRLALPPPGTASAAAAALPLCRRRRVAPLRREPSAARRRARAGPAWAAAAPCAGRRWPPPPRALAPPAPASHARPGAPGRTAPLPLCVLFH